MVVRFDIENEFDLYVNVGEQAAAILDMPSGMSKEDAVNWVEAHGLVFKISTFEQKYESNVYVNLEFVGVASLDDAGPLYKKRIVEEVV